MVALSVVLVTVFLSASPDRPPAPAPVPVPRSDASASGFGMSVSPGTFEGRTPAQLDKIFADLQGLGLRWARVSLFWLRVQPDRGGPYDWSSFDPIVRSARAHGIRVIGLVGSTPSWARSPSCTGTGGWEEACPPTGDVAAYAAVNAAMAARYPDLVVEVWNEPNQARFWSPAPDPAQYTAVLIATNAAVKRVSPRTTVLTGGLTVGSNDPGAGEMNPVTFLRELYDRGAGGQFDAVSWHPYLSHPVGTPVPVPGRPDEDSAWFQMYGATQNARALMVERGDADKRIWVTEFGVNTNVPDTLSGTEAEQAAMFTEAIRFWRGVDWAGPFCFYTYGDSATYGTNPDGEYYFGLWRIDDTPKPAAAAVREAIASP